MSEEAAPPEGFVESRDRGPFTTHNGPLFHRMDGDRFLQGFRVLKRHCNGAGVVHGGMLMAFADGLMGGAVWRAAKAPALTVRMTSDFLAIARPGDWVEGAARVTRLTRSLAFVDAQVTARGSSVLTASGVFKIMEAHAERAARRAARTAPPSA